MSIFVEGELTSNLIRPIQHHATMTKFGLCLITRNTGFIRLDIRIGYESSRCCRNRIPPSANCLCAHMPFFGFRSYMNVQQDSDDKAKRTFVVCIYSEGSTSLVAMG